MTHRVTASGARGSGSSRCRPSIRRRCVYCRPRETSNSLRYSILVSRIGDPAAWEAGEQGSKSTRQKIRLSRHPTLPQVSKVVGQITGPVSTIGMQRWFSTSPGSEQRTGRAMTWRYWTLSVIVSDRPSSRSIRSLKAGARHWGRWFPFYRKRYVCQPASCASTPSRVGRPGAITSRESASGPTTGAD
jgi:hypothetical protein